MAGDPVIAVAQQETAGAVEDAIMPIAVVGMGFRGPGDAADIESFYKTLAEARQTWSPIPKERWNAEAHYHPDGMRDGSSNVKGGHFFKQDLSRFDAPFFNMTPAETACLDPQQRLLLETCYEALENSGTSLANVVGSDTATFVATFNGDYTDTLLRDPETIPVYQATNSGHNRATISNRLAYFFDFKGTSVTVDTACSASLTAFHLACQALRTGDARQAIVGGASVILSSDLLISMSAMRMFSPDGRSYSFDERANGYARGEGAGCIMLKPLHQALADRDTIRAVVRNTGSNQDGKTLGITFPNRDSQMALTRKLYLQAGLDPLHTTYVEAHGTGTQAGDPIETSAISETIALDRPPDRPLIIGSVKSNVGHMEGASGISGLVKSILMLENGVLLPNHDFKKPNDRIPLEDWRLKVATEYTPWQPHDGLSKRLSISSFGFGGTNAHAILEEADGYLRTRKLPGRRSKTFALTQSPARMDGYTERDAESPKPRLLVLSAADPVAGRAFALVLAQYVRARLHVAADAFLDNLAYTINFRRSRLAFVSPVAARSADELIEALESDSLEFTKTKKTDVLGFVFTGQGAQWPCMGKGLMEAFPVYRKAIERCSEQLQALGATWDPIRELEKDGQDSQINTSKLSQPLCTAVQIGLVDLLASWAIRPASVTGHSSGEIAAAYAAGALTLEDAVRAAYYRGVVAHQMASKGEANGAMMAVGMSSTDATPMVESLTQGTASIACVNSPSSITVSGDAAAIDELEASLQSKQIFARKLAVPVAYHSHHMQFVGQEYADSISEIETKPTTVDFFSSVSGVKASHAELGPDYWVANLLGQVKFAEALRMLGHETAHPTKRQRKGAQAVAVSAVIEVGPHAALAGPIRQIFQAEEKLKKANIAYHSTLVRKQDSVSAILALASSLIRGGYGVDLTALSLSKKDAQPMVLPDLPPYQWNHSVSYWAEGRLSKAYRNRPYARHDLLGAEDRNFNPLEPRWRNILRCSEAPWLKDHRIQSNVVFPAAGYIAVAMQASLQRATSRGMEVAAYAFRDVVIGQALVIPEDTGEAEINVSLKPSTISAQMSSDRWDEFFIYAVSADGRWAEHSRGLVSVQAKKTTTNEVNSAVESGNAFSGRLKALQDRCTEEVATNKFYEGLTELGLEYGATFANVTSLKAGDGVAVGQVRIPDTAAVVPLEYESSYVLHPSTLDAILHPLFAAVAGSGKLKDPMVPTFIEEMVVSCEIERQTGKHIEVACSTEMTDGRHCKAHIAASHIGRAAELPPLLEISGLTCVALTRGGDRAKESKARKTAFEMRWSADVDFLAAGNVLASGDCLDGMAKYVGLVMHKIPGAKVLCMICVDHPPDITPLLKSLGGADPGITLPMVLITGRSETYDLQETYGPWENMLGYRPSQDLEDNRFDVVLHLDCCAPFGSLRLIKPDGFFLTPNGQSQLPETDVCMKDMGCFGLLRRRRAVVPPQEPVIIIGDDLSHQDLKKHLISELRDQNPNVDSVFFLNADPSGKVCIVVCDLLTKMLQHVDAATWGILKKICLQSAGVIWVTQGSGIPLSGMVTGLLRTVRSEHGQAPMIALDLDDANILPSDKAACKVTELYGAVFLRKHEAPESIESEFQVRSGQLLIPRLIEDVQTNAALHGLTTEARPIEMRFHQSGRPLRIHVGSPGLLDSLHFVDDEQVAEPLADDCVEVEVKAVGLNFRDVMLSLGQIAPDDLGAELSGIVTAVGQSVTTHQVGERVAGCHLGAFRNFARPNALLMTAIPEGTSFETAAVLPIAYCTAYYSLFNIAKLQRGESVLIHVAAGGVGQAALEFCRLAGAVVFATVGSADKKSFLVKEFGLKPENIFYSRDGSFAKGITAATKGYGVDVILNSLAGEALRLTWSCIAPYGRFIELGKRDFFINSRLDMAKFAKNVSFTAVDLVGLIRDKPMVVSDVWKQVIDLMSIGVVRAPIPITTYSIGQLPEALSIMRSGKHTGKLVVVPSLEDTVKAIPAKNNQHMLDGTGSYVLVGGLGGVGRAIALWMSEHAARNIVFINRSGAEKQEAKDTLSLLRKRGINAIVLSCDVSDASELASLLKPVQLTWPIKGVIQGAMVLRDAMLDSMTVEDWNAAVKSKVQGTVNLHEALPKDLDFFLMLSSISGIIGNASQANYAAANTFMDAFAGYRRSLGLKATALNLGVIQGVGHVAEDAGLATAMERQGFEGMGEKELMTLIQCAISGRSTTEQVVSGLGAYEPATSIESVSNSPLFAEYRRMFQASATTTGDSADSIRAVLSSCSSREQATGVILAALVEKTASLCMVPQEDISTSKPLSIYGLDSLVAVEMRNWISKQFDCTFPILELLANTSMATVAQRMAGKSRLLDKLE